MKRKRVTSDIRGQIWDASAGKCFHCGKELHPWRNFHVDHLEPLADGGADDFSNMVASCAECNLKRGGRMGTRSPVVLEPVEPITAEALTRRREALGLNQSQLAEALGLPRNTVWRWESGKFTIMWPRMLALAMRGLEQEIRERGSNTDAGDIGDAPGGGGDRAVTSAAVAGAVAVEEFQDGSRSAGVGAGDGAGTSIAGGRLADDAVYH